MDPAQCHKPDDTLITAQCRYRDTLVTAHCRNRDTLVTAQCRHRDTLVTAHCRNPDDTLVNAQCRYPNDTLATAQCCNPDDILDAAQCRSPDDGLVTAKCRNPDTLVSVQCRNLVDPKNVRVFHLYRGQAFVRNRILVSWPTKSAVSCTDYQDKFVYMALHSEAICSAVATVRAI
jgi:hypothetical protein